MFILKTSRSTNNQWKISDGLFANPNCPFSAGITVRFEPAWLSVFRKNPCPFSTGINVRFPQEMLSAFSKNKCPFCAGFCRWLVTKLSITRTIG